jgi:FkbM family methyltransferase
MNELQRSLMTISCRDTDSIPKVMDAGQMTEFQGERVQIMHNGIRVVYSGYYGDWMAHIIRGLGGHHEPQEELLFHTLMRYVRNQSVIFELGAFWSYYSQWFLKVIPNSTAVCIEPDPNNLLIGRRNAELNGTTDRVQFVNAWVGGEHLDSHSAPTETSKDLVTLPMLNFPALLDYYPDKCIEVLHVDAQGAELPLLQSIDAASAQNRLRFVMVSTHHSSISGSKYCHPNCLEILRNLGATILAEHDVVESYSGDGLILASMFPEDCNLWFPEISRNRAETSLFKES